MLFHSSNYPISLWTSSLLVEQTANFHPAASAAEIRSSIGWSNAHSLVNQDVLWVYEHSFVTINLSMIRDLFWSSPIKPAQKIVHPGMSMNFMNIKWWQSAQTLQLTIGHPPIARSCNYWLPIVPNRMQVQCPYKLINVHVPSCSGMNTLWPPSIKKIATEITLLPSQNRWVGFVGSTLEAHQDSDLMGWSWIPKTQHADFALSFPRFFPTEHEPFEDVSPIKHGGDFKY